MTTDAEIAAWIAKAHENLDSAARDFAEGSSNASANRAYYAAYQAAISALCAAGIRPVGGGWGHDYVQAQFAGQLIVRRKLYPAALRDTLTRLFNVRRRADYEPLPVSATQAERALRQAQAFVNAVTRQIEA